MPRKDMNELLKPIPGWPKYYASSLGFIFSEKTGAIVRLKGFPNTRSGYLTVLLRNGAKTKRLYVHRLILETFSRTPTPVDHCRHLDGSRTNNNISNLVWGTKADNELDKRKHGRIQKGEDHHRSKLSAHQISLIRLSSENQYDLADKYGVSQSNISMIKNFKTWGGG